MLNEGCKSVIDLIDSLWLHAFRFRSPTKTDDRNDNGNGLFVMETILPSIGLSFFMQCPIHGENIKGHFPFQVKIIK